MTWSNRPVRLTRDKLTDSLKDTGQPVSMEIRCPNCNRLVGKRTASGGGFEVKCRGCSTMVAA